ncbi:MAG: heavy metal transport/detoxification [Geobacteraceae bacterium]|nr:MAG: heavy metal transport/detoxification [Geobacteraceae bacterium]
MKKGKIINIVLVIAVVALLTAFAFSVRIKPTADNVAVLKTAGMTCGSCANDIEKALQAKRGVAAVEVDVDGGWVVVGFDSKKTELDVIASTVAGLGYRNRVAELLSVERFRAITGRDPGTKVKSMGCGGGCGNRK